MASAGARAYNGGLRAALNISGITKARVVKFCVFVVYIKR